MLVGVSLPEVRLLLEFRWYQPFIVHLHSKHSLVGGLEYIFPYIGNVIIPTDSYFSEG